MAFESVQTQEMQTIAKEDIKPSQPTMLELPTLRPVPQLEPVNVEPPRSEIQLPQLKSVPQAEPAKVEPPRAEIAMPQLKPVVLAPVAAPEPKPEPEPPQLRPVAADVKPVETADEPPVEWQPPPLDLRPNLQALLEKEKEAVAAVQAAAPAPVAPKVILKQPPPVVKTLLDEEAQAAHEAELARLSVRGKIQRLEAATKSMAGTNSIKSTSSVSHFSSQSTSTYNSIVSSPNLQRKMTPTPMPTPSPVSSGWKENANPAMGKIQYRAQVKSRLQLHNEWSISAWV